MDAASALVRVDHKGGKAQAGVANGLIGPGVGRAGLQLGDQADGLPRRGIAEVAGGHPRERREALAVGARDRGGFVVAGEQTALDGPVGTEIVAEDGETVLKDMVVAGERFLIAKGGKGDGCRHGIPSAYQVPYSFCQ